jgi:hypothetical protein
VINNISFFMLVVGRRAVGKGLRATSKGLRAKSQAQSAKSKRQRAKRKGQGGKQKAKGGEKPRAGSWTPRAGWLADFLREDEGGPPFSKGSGSKVAQVPPVGQSVLAAAPPGAASPDFSRSARKSSNSLSKA